MVPESSEQSHPQGQSVGHWLGVWGCGRHGDLLHTWEVQVLSPKQDLRRWELAPQENMVRHPQHLPQLQKQFMPGFKIFYHPSCHEPLGFVDSEE